MPIERTNAIMRILKRGSPKPPKNPTIRIKTVARAIIAGILQMIGPMPPTKTHATTTESPTKENMDMDIQCVHASLSVSQIVSFSGGVNTLTPYLCRLSSTWASVKPV